MRFKVARYICMSIFINRIITRECAIFMRFIFRRFCCSCSCRYSRCCCKHLQLLTVALACVNLIIIVVVVVSLGSPFSHMPNEAHGFDLYTQSHTFTYAHTHTFSVPSALISIRGVYITKWTVCGALCLHVLVHTNKVIVSGWLTHLAHSRATVSGLVLVWFNYFVSVLGNERARKHGSCL